MKKFFSCLILIFSFIACSFASVSATALPEQPDNYNDYATYNMLEEFVTANPSRTAGTQGEKDAAVWIFNRLKNLGYENRALMNFEIYSYVVDGEDVSYNVVANKVSNQPNAKTVILGAHYDNATAIYNAGGQGAADNGGGVAVLLTLAQKLANVDLPYNLQFVFFGAEEIGMQGSEFFTDSLTPMQKDEILLMINVDTITHGDNLYVWGEDVNTPQADYFIKVGKGKVVKTPANKRSVMSNLLGYRPYYNTAHASDHMPFLDVGIPVAFFFSGNLSSGQFGYVENDGMTDILHTPNDTLAYLKERFGMHFIDNMESVTDTVYSGLIDSAAFLSATENARSFIISDFWLNSRYASLILILLLAIVGVLAYYYHKKLRKRAILGTPDAKNEKIFTRPDEDDVFTFRD